MTLETLIMRLEPDTAQISSLSLISSLFSNPTASSEHHIYFNQPTKVLDAASIIK